MGELNGGGLTKPALDELREKMRGVLGETISAEARRLSGVVEDDGLNSKNIQPTERESDVAEWILQLVAKRVREVLVPLKQRIAELEGRPSLKYEGVWNETKVYRVGDFVTDHGSLWHAWNSNVGARPGSSDVWQLAVQRGRDGKSKGDR